MAKQEDPNAFLQLMYEQNSELDDVARLEGTAIATPDAEVPAGPKASRSSQQSGAQPTSAPAAVQTE